MIQVHFSGYADWFTKDNNGESHPRIETVSWIEYDSYHRKYVHVTPDNVRFGDYFILTEEDELKYKEKEIRHKKYNIDFDKNNLNFVNELLIFPDPLDHSRVDDIEENGKHYLKIRKYKNSVPKLEDRLDYTLYPIAFFEENTKAESTANNLNKSNNTLDPRAETSYLLIIAALLEYISGKAPGIDKHPSFEGESKLIEKIDKLYGEYRGISKRTLEDKFPKAKASLKDLLR